MRIPWCRRPALAAILLLACAQPRFVRGQPSDASLSATPASTDDAATRTANLILGATLGASDAATPTEDVYSTSLNYTVTSTTSSTDVPCIYLNVTVNGSSTWTETSTYSCASSTTESAT